MDPPAKNRAILDAAEALFVAHGYEGTSIADIARRAGVAVGTVYRLHADKPALLTALHRRMEDRFVAATFDGWQSRSDYTERFRAMFTAIFAEAAASRAAMPLYGMTKEASGGAGYVPGAAIVATIAALYGEGQAAGALRDGKPGLMAAIAYGMTDAALRHWLASDACGMPEPYVDVLAVLACRAFLA